MAANIDVIATDSMDLQLEAMRKDDCSWHPCQVTFSPNGAGLVIKYENNDSEDILVSEKEALMRIRVRSLPLQNDDCTHIKPGEHVVVNRNSESEAGFFDAEVEKVLPVRHSKRMNCRCTFMIKWLHEDLNGGSSKVPSSSIMRLANKSINKHPTISAFLDALPLNNTSFSAMSPQLNMVNDFDFDLDLDLHDLLDKQIEGIRNSVHGAKKRIRDEILGLEDFSVPNPSTEEELPDNKSPLNPLAARAALASLMSLPKTLEISNDDDISTITKLPSKTESTTKSVKTVKKLLFSTSSSTKPRQDKTNTEVQTRSTRAKTQKVNKIPDNNKTKNSNNIPTNKRFTRSVLQKEGEDLTSETKVEKDIISDNEIMTEVDFELTTRNKIISKLEIGSGDEISKTENRKKVMVDSELITREKIISKTEKGKNGKTTNLGNVRRLTRSMISETVKESGGDENTTQDSKGNVTSDEGCSNGVKKNVIDFKKQKVRSSPRFINPKN